MSCLNGKNISPYLFNDNNNNNNIIIIIIIIINNNHNNKEKEKIENYNELKYEFKRLWNCRRVDVIPLFVGALAKVSKNFEMWWEKINIAGLQKACLLGTACKDHQKGAGYLRLLGETWYIYSRCIWP